MASLICLCTIATTHLSSVHTAVPQHTNASAQQHQCLHAHWGAKHDVSLHRSATTLNICTSHQCCLCTPCALSVNPLCAPHRPYVPRTPPAHQCFCHTAPMHIVLRRGYTGGGLWGTGNTRGVRPQLLLTPMHPRAPCVANMHRLCALCTFCVRIPASHTQGSTGGAQRVGLGFFPLAPPSPLDIF